MKTVSVATKQHPTQHNQDEYQDIFLGSMQGYFNNLASERNLSLFTTNATDLFDIFLDNLPDADIRQHYNCRACRVFVTKFGGLVTIEANGKTAPVIWPMLVPQLYRQSVEAVRDIVSNAKVTGVFLEASKTWGKPITGEWHHMAITPNGMAFNHPLKSASQMMAEKKQDYLSLMNGLLEFPAEAVNQALKVLGADSLSRSDKVIGVAEWLKGLHQQRIITPNNRTKNNLLWLAVATAPPGFCHIKSTMIGSLLADIVNGYSFDAISRRWASKIDPLQYQRPQVPPSDGNVAQAEKIFKTMGLEPSLGRRFARLDELELIWKPRKGAAESPKGEGGVFSHLTTKNNTPKINELRIPAITVTWEKFHKTILGAVIGRPNAIQFFVPHGAENYAGMITAANFDAPPILQWDTESQRNPVSRYVYAHGSPPSRWELQGGVYHTVNGICLRPQMWHGGGLRHQGEGVVFILDGAVDRHATGNMIFPETLKSELHAVRSTVEAYSKSATLTGQDEASACGVALDKGSINWDGLFRVVTATGDTIEYKIDRWD